MSLEELIEKYVDNEDKDKMESLFQYLSKEGTSEEKEELADGYLSLYAQCQYDFTCGKFNDPDEIWELKDWVDKVKILNPEFEYENYYLAHVYDMLSAASKQENDRIDFCEKAILHFRKQIAQDREDVDLLINLAETIVKRCNLIHRFEEDEMNEAIALFSEAMQMEREEAHQHSFFGFNGSGIHHFLHTAYELLDMPDGVAYHKVFLSSFKETIQPLAAQDPMVYYYWIDTLFDVMSWAEHAEKYKGKAFPGVEEEIWKGILEILPFITNIESDQEFFLTSIGHLFQKVAAAQSSIQYYETALHYYQKALEINGETWSSPTYAAGSLQAMALLFIQKGNYEQAKQWYEQGLEIYNLAQERISDFQLSLNHGEYLFEYARVFEGFSNLDTLQKSQKRFEESREMGKDFYTGPYYGLAKVALRMNDQVKSLSILKKCKEVFSNEYHTHDFREIIDDTDFAEVHSFLLEISNDQEETNP